LLPYVSRAQTGARFSQPYDNETLALSHAGLWEVGPFSFPRLSYGACFVAPL